MFDRWQGEYLAGKDPRDPLASPAYANLRGLQLLLMQIGMAVMLFDQVIAFAQRAKAAAVEVTFESYPDRVHLWHALAPLFPEFQESFDRIGKFVRERAN